jgi:hypothetical protein
MDQLVLHSKYKDFSSESKRAISDFLYSLKEKGYIAEVYYGHYVDKIPSIDEIDEYYAWFTIIPPYKL